MLRPSLSLSGLLIESLRGLKGESLSNEAKPVMSDLDRYELKERIAIGGMAEIFLATLKGREGFARPLVVKRMLPMLAETPEAVKMFLDEAHLGAMLQHRNITSVIDLGQGIDKSYFLVMEFVDGPSLSSLLGYCSKRNILLPPQLVAHICARVADGLHYAHTLLNPETSEPLHLVHRDVSPQNILLSKQGDVKITDFGVAKSERQEAVTRSGVVKGKLSYMAPEQLQGEHLDGRTDTFALGVVLYEALVLERLFKGKTDLETMNKILTWDPPPPSSLNPKVDPSLDAIVLKSLAKAPKDRYQSCSDFSFALDRWTREVGRPQTASSLSQWLKENAPEVGAQGAPRQPKDGRSPTTGLVKIQPEKKPAGGLRRVRKEDSSSRPSVGGLKAIKKPVKKDRERVLYVEDEKHNWEVTQMRLERTYELLLAADDRSACDIVREQGDSISAILMDIQLKGSRLDGIELTRLFRGKLNTTDLPDYAKGIAPISAPIIFVTAYAGRYSEAELMEAGGDKLITKPVNFMALTLALTNLHLAGVKSR